MSYSYSDPPSCCSSASAELKLYQAFIFSIPIFFTFVLLFLFYLFYLRRRRVDWSSLRMRASSYQNEPPGLREPGLKKELREMLPIIVYKETFSISDTQCSVCLGDYQAEDKLQQIPACGHTFHMDCIDNWLATHTTCPLCRLSLVPTPKTDSDPPSIDQSEAHQQAQQAQAQPPPNEGGPSQASNGDLESQGREQGAADSPRRSNFAGYGVGGKEEVLCSAARVGDEVEGLEVSEVVVVDDVEAQTSTLQETATSVH